MMSSITVWKNLEAFTIANGGTTIMTIRTMDIEDYEKVYDLFAHEIPAAQK